MKVEVFNVCVQRYILLAVPTYDVNSRDPPRDNCDGN